jgi:hypothetical protein
MSAIKDLTGQVFGRLTAIRRVGSNKWGNSVWDCVCECKNRVEIAGGGLTYGNSTSCGCFQRESTAARSRRDAPGFRDLSGQVFSRLTVLRFVRRDKRGAAIFICQCSCDGKEIEVWGSNLISGNTKSCSCIQRELMASKCGENSPHFKHGHSLQSGVSPTFTSWTAMIQRCTNPNHEAFSRYAGANPPVTIDSRWLGEHGFENFLADVGERPEGTTLGRFGDIGNYEKSNCAWQNWIEQRAEQKIKKQLKFLVAA